MYDPSHLYDLIIAARQRDGLSAPAAIERVWRDLEPHADEVFRDAGRWLLARVEQAFRQHSSAKPILIERQRRADVHDRSAVGDNRQASSGPTAGVGGDQIPPDSHVEGVATNPGTAWHDRIPWLEVEMSIFGPSGRKRLGDAVVQDFTAAVNQRDRTAATLSEQATILRRVRDEMHAHGDRNFRAFADRVGHRAARRLISKVEPKLLPRTALGTLEREKVL